LSGAFFLFSSSHFLPSERCRNRRRALKDASLLKIKTGAVSCRLKVTIKCRLTVRTSFSLLSAQKRLLWMQNRQEKSQNFKLGRDLLHLPAVFVKNRRGFLCQKGVMVVENRLPPRIQPAEPWKQASGGLLRGRVNSNKHPKIMR
jgi:hypothetical protein